jgi:23S rRNA pseudouridine2605 synthase
MPRDSSMAAAARSRPRPKRAPEVEREGVRLQKVLAAAGIASRRASEELIARGRVAVDGRIVTELGTRVDPERARIEVDGVRVSVRRDHEYVILNKPLDVITTAKDTHGRRTVLDLVRSQGRLFPVGRLDADTTGVLILTDDGELAHRLAHPRFAIPRVYIAEVRGSVADETCRKLERGLPLDDGPARAISARVQGRGRRSTQIEITMTEGRKREVRRMLEAVGHPVSTLARVSFGPVRLSGLRLGATRSLSPAEVGELYKLVGL